MIVVGLDGSPTSWHAAAYAGGVARRQGAKLLVVHVIVPNTFAMMTPAGYAVLTETMEQIDAELRDEVMRLAEGRGIEVEFVAATGDVFTELCRVAEEAHADALVVGASRSAGHRLVGSIAARLVKAARCPVTVVP